MNKTIRLTRLSALCLGAALMSGCEPITLTMASIGASAGVSHTLGGIIYKTFTAPQRTVERASIRALRDMGIDVVDKEVDENGDTTIHAKAREREIRILLEPITPRTTRMRTTANNGLLMDSATATEIVLQTERVLVGA
jgi:hypothetical protein